MSPASSISNHPIRARLRLQSIHSVESFLTKPIPWRPPLDHEPHHWRLSPGTSTGSPSVGRHAHPLSELISTTLSYRQPIPRLQPGGEALWNAPSTAGVPTAPGLVQA